jgi:hypothetical protein
MPRRPGSRPQRLVVEVPTVHLARAVPRELAAAQVRSGAWVPATRGAYVAAGTSPRGMAVARAIGVHARLTSIHAFSHETAALLHGLALWTLPNRTHVRHEHRGGARNDAATARHLGLPAQPGIVDRLGLPLTDLATTAWDCLTTLRPLPALVVADSALRAGLTVEVLHAEAAEARGNGTARARRLLELVDDGAESARETWLRFAFLAAGWPAPETQVCVETGRGTYWADLGWPEWRLLVEYDGLDKYSSAPSVALLDEKLRRDAIAEAGWRSVHVTKADTRTDVLQRVLPYVPAGALTGVRPRRALTLPRAA